MEKKNLVLFSPQIETFTSFANSVEASRLNMSSKQQTQACVSNLTETPFIIDKNYLGISEVDSPFSQIAQDDGYVILSSRETIIIYYTSLKKLVSKHVPKFKKMVNLSLGVKYIAPVGPIKKGELLFDYTNMNPESKMPRIGYRTKILFSSFFGYTSDDALVVSESFARRAQISYSQKLFIPVTKKWKYLRNGMDQYFFSPGQVMDIEEYIKFFNIDTSEHFVSEIQNLSSQESLFFTKNIKGILGGNIQSVKVHKNNKKSFVELDQEYIYTPGLIREIETFYNNNIVFKNQLQETFKSIGLSDEENLKLTEEIYSSYYGVDKFPKSFDTKLKDEFGLDPTEVDFLLEVDIAITVGSTRGDKFTNLYAGKGVISMIIPDELMPAGVDAIFNPLGIFGRNNWGSVFELGLSKIIEDVESKVEDQEAIRERVMFINEHYIKKIDEDYYKKVQELLSQKELFEDFLEDVKKNGFFLYSSNFNKLKYKEFFDEFLDKYGSYFGIFMGKEEVEISEDLIKWLRDKWHYKNRVFGDQVYSKTIKGFIGSNYWLKLHHTSYSKYTSVSFANSYSKITGQPARGRKKQGGQHISWQTLAALLAHKEKNGMLKELYTIKSDSTVTEKETFILRYVTDGGYDLNPKYSSLTKRAVNTALKLIGMEFND